MNRQLPLTANPFTTNPFAQRLMRQSGLLGSQAFTFGCLALGLVLSLVAMINAVSDKGPYRNFDPVAVFIFVTALSMIISLPLFLTFAATAVTVTYIQSAEYLFLCLTNLSPGKIIQGFLLATLYRSRALIVLVLALCPALAITIRFGSMYTSTLGYGLSESLLKHVLVGCLLMGVVSSVSLFGMTIGIGLGLWWQNTLAANAAATVIIIAFTSRLFSYLGGFLTTYFWLNDFMSDALLLLLFIPVPCLLAGLILTISRRWARQPGRHAWSGQVER